MKMTRSLLLETLLVTPVAARAKPAVRRDQFCAVFSTIARRKDPSPSAPPCCRRRALVPAPREGRMNIVKCLFRIWTALTVAAVAIDIACFSLVGYLPAAQNAEQANVFLSTFLISAPAPVLIVPALVAVGLFWGVLRWLSHLMHRRGLAHRQAPSHDFGSASHGRI
jgi:hypothetical protein